MLEEQENEATVRRQHIWDSLGLSLREGFWSHRSDVGTELRPKSLTSKPTPGERVAKDIRRATRRHFSAEDKIRVVRDGLRSEDCSAEVCSKEGIA